MQKARLPSLESTIILFKTTFCPSQSPFASVPPPLGRVGVLGNIVVSWFATMLRSTSQDAAPGSLSRSPSLETSAVFGLCSFGLLKTQWDENLTGPGWVDCLRELCDCTLGVNTVVQKVFL